MCATTAVVVVRWRLMMTQTSEELAHWGARMFREKLRNGDA
jgi:hypothetical protein